LIRNLLTAAAAFMLIAGSAAPSIAAPCRDGKGKFIKCAHAGPKKPIRCKTAAGKFAKCGTPGAKPA